MGRAKGVSPGIQMRRDCETRLRELVPPEETIVSVGTAEELRELRPNIGSGGGWTFVVVTDEQVLFALWGPPGKPHESIHLDEVTHWADGKQYNCYVLVLTHPPMTRREWVVAHRLLWFKWGDDEADVTRTQTIFVSADPRPRPPRQYGRRWRREASLINYCTSRRDRGKSELAGTRCWQCAGECTGP